MEKVLGNVTEFDFHQKSQDMRGLASAVLAYIDQLGRVDEVRH